MTLLAAQRCAEISAQPLPESQAESDPRMGSPEGFEAHSEFGPEALSDDSPAGFEAQRDSGHSPLSSSQSSPNAA